MEKGMRKAIRKGRKGSTRGKLIKEGGIDGGRTGK